MFDTMGFLLEPGLVAAEIFVSSVAVFDTVNNSLG